MLGADVVYVSLWLMLSEVVLSLLALPSLLSLPRSLLGPCAFC